MRRSSPRGGHQLDLLAQHLAAKILDRNLGGLDRIFAAIFGIDAGLIVQDADLDALRRRDRMVRRGRRSRLDPDPFPVAGGQAVHNRSTRTNAEVRLRIAW